MPVLIAAIGAIGIFAACVVAIIAFVYLVLAPRHTTSRADDPVPYALCTTCGQPVRGCQHPMGVPSTWVHVRTGNKYGPDGHLADHR